MIVEEPAQVKIFSENFQDFKDALESLYIRDNLSGRNHFRTTWPDVAEFLFGADLVAYDTHGVKDKEHRAELEQAAEDRQKALLKIIAGIEELSVQGGAISREYIEEAMKSMTREVALCIYKEDLVDKFHAPPVKESGFNLAGKKNIIQVDFKEPKSISYDDLVAQALAEEPSFPPMRDCFNQVA